MCLELNEQWGKPANESIDADPQQQEAASPLVLMGRSFLR
jgi:hypothetical protein